MKSTSNTSIGSGVNLQFADKSRIQYPNVYWIRQKIMWVEEEMIITQKQSGLCTSILRRNLLSRYDLSLLPEAGIKNT